MWGCSTLTPHIFYILSRILYYVSSIVPASHISVYLFDGRNMLFYVCIMVVPTLARLV
jgi:hypothetical protein